MVNQKPKDEFYCYDLPTHPLANQPTILVTGATGYIGGCLVPELIHRGYNVRVLVRKYSAGYNERWPMAEVVVGDAEDPLRLAEAMKGVHTAYYLIHSLMLGNKKFEKVDLQIATNFRLVAEQQKIKRIIYLGGLGDLKSGLSPHLNNRINVANELSRGLTPVTMLRAGMIIGSGSASYEILKHLVINTPIFFIPKWAKTRSQPISIRGVIKYLVGVLEIEETVNRSFDIGGIDIVTYDEKLKILAGLLGKKRYFFPGLNTRTNIYAYVASLFTTVPRSITKVLVDSCKNEAVCQNDDIKKYLDIEFLSFEEALLMAISQGESRKNLPT